MVVAVRGDGGNSWVEGLQEANLRKRQLIQDQDGCNLGKGSQGCNNVVVTV